MTFIIPKPRMIIVSNKTFYIEIIQCCGLPTAEQVMLNVSNFSPRFLFIERYSIKTLL